jgi:molybdenum cofactor cytidylyltransferase
MKTQPTVVVLAAGCGSRFKGNAHKLLQPFGSTTVLGATLEHAIETGLPVRVVTMPALTSQAARHVALRDIVELPDPSQGGGDRLGMGFSIANGVSASADAAGWLILPGDMPMVRAATLLAVAGQLSQHAVVFAQYQGRRGHPVGFAAELLSELVQLTGDEGARRVAARYPSFGLEVDDPGVLIDVDTEDDLAGLFASTEPSGTDRRRAAT